MTAPQEPVPLYALAPLLIPTLGSDEHAESLHHESPDAIQHHAQRSIRCSESDGTHLYIGTSDGQIHSFNIRYRKSATAPGSSQQCTYSLKSSRSVSNHTKPVEKIVLLRPFRAAAVLCEGVVNFFSTPDWTPIRSLPSTRAVSTIVLDDEEAQSDTGTDAAGMISVCLVRRKNIILAKIGSDGRSDLLWSTIKDVPLPGGAIFARRYADTLCIANATEYSLVNLSSGSITQLHLPISQTGESPSAQVRPSIVAVPVPPSSQRQGSVSPEVGRASSAAASPSANCEFLVTSHSGSITLGVFVKPSGEPAPKLLEWPSHPRSVAFDGKHLVSLLRNDTLELHRIGSDSTNRVQTIQLPPGLDPRFLQPVSHPAAAHPSASNPSVSTISDLDIVKVSLAHVDSSDATLLSRAQEHPHASLPSRCQILLCGRNSTSAVQQDSLLGWTAQQLRRGRIRNLRHSLASYRENADVDATNSTALQSSLEASAAHARLGIELLHRADFAAAANVLRHAHLDPRLILGCFPSLLQEGQALGEAILPALLLPDLEKLKRKEGDGIQSIQDIIVANLTLNYSPPLDVNKDRALSELKQTLLHRSDAMLRRLLEDWRAAAANAAHPWAGAYMDEHMLANVHNRVDSAYLHLLAQGRGTDNPDAASIKREMAAFLDSNHACEPTVVEKLLKDKGFLLLLARHYESVGNIEGALNILAGLVDGKQGDALEQSIDTSATVSKIADLLSGQQDASLVSEYGRWLVRKDPEAGIRILTAQTAASDSAATSKTPSRSKAQELDAIRLQKATIDELRQIDAEAATKYLEVVALSTSKVQDEQMHRELAAALIRRVAKHLEDGEYRTKMESIEHEYAHGSYAESFFAHLALACSGSSMDVDRLKLSMLLQGSTMLDHGAVLSMIEPLPTLAYERAIVLGKLGRDADALSLLAITLRDANSAEAYCSQDGEVLSPMLAASIAEDHEELRPFAAMLSRTHAQRIKTHAKQEQQAGRTGAAQRKETLLKELLSVYMANGAHEKFRIATAHLLNTQALHLDSQQVLELVPADWSIQTLETFLTQSLRRQLHRRREVAMLRSIAKCRNLDLAEDLWARQRAMGGVVQDTDLGGAVDSAGSYDAVQQSSLAEGQVKAHIDDRDDGLGEKHRSSGLDTSDRAKVEIVHADYSIPTSAVVHAEREDGTDSDLG
jgi:hypothetical protein